jgi:trehalose utilization protein
MEVKIRVTVWNEYRDERTNPEIAKIYPKGIHGAIAQHLKTLPEFDVRTATLDEPEHGLADNVLNNTDVLIWWGHIAHDEVKNEIVEKIYKRILYEGMGLIALHSAGASSKIFCRLIGTTCHVKSRDAGEKERLWVVSPGHPIAKGIGDYFEIERTEMYGEYYDIPPPDELIFISWFQGGEVFRSGCCFYRGMGKIFYFRPGHETYPIYHDANVLKVIRNAIYWAQPTERPRPTFGPVEPLEELPLKP